MASSNLSSLVLITGANRGLGQSLSVYLGKKLQNACFMISGRTEESLKSTIDLMKDVNSNVRIHPFILDQCNISESYQINQLNACLSEKKFDVFIIIHNAGSIGDVSKLSYEFENDYVENYFKTNLTGMIFLNKLFLSSIKSHLTPNSKTLIINISSLAAIKSFPSWSLYCTGKAAREMFFNCLAEEWKNQNKVDEKGNLYVINYAPGPLKTDMMTYLLNNTADNELKDGMNDLASKDGLLDASESANRLYEKLIYPRIMSNEKFEGAVRCDYFDF